jgi:hypothetical protein
MTVQFSFYFVLLGACTLGSTEAEFLDVIRTKVLRGFLLAIQRHLYEEIFTPPPPWEKVVWNCFVILELRTLKIMPRNLNQIVLSWIRLLQTQDCAPSSYEYRQMEYNCVSTFSNYSYERKKMEQIWMHHQSITQIFLSVPLTSACSTCQREKV